jgi:hypothetical protein
VRNIPILRVIHIEGRINTRRHTCLKYCRRPSTDPNDGDEPPNICSFDHGRPRCWAAPP